MEVFNINFLKLTPLIHGCVDEGMNNNAGDAMAVWVVPIYGSDYWQLGFNELSAELFLSASSCQLTKLQQLLHVTFVAGGRTAHHRVLISMHSIKSSGRRRRTDTQCR